MDDESWGEWNITHFQLPATFVGSKDRLGSYCIELIVLSDLTIGAFAIHGILKTGHFGSKILLG
jgi:hypothetical protein